MYLKPLQNSASKSFNDTEKNIAIKSYDKFTVFHILSSNSREHVQKVTKPKTLYLEEESLEKLASCVKAPIVINVYLICIFWKRKTIVPLIIFL